MQKIEQIEQIIEQGKLAIQSLEKVHNELANSSSQPIDPNGNPHQN